MKQQIQKLRNQTGAGIMAIKKALAEANGDETKALDILKKQGQKIAAKKMDEREAKDGIIEGYVHSNGKVASLVMLSCETDFVAKNSEFKQLARDIAMQVAAMNPQYLSSETIPAEVIEKEKEIIREELKQENKLDEVIEKIMPGKLEKFYSHVCLLNQKFIKDDKKTVGDILVQAISKLGEKIEVKKIARLSMSS